jgi:hypothetical protein
MSPISATNTPATCEGAGTRTAFPSQGDPFTCRRPEEGLTPAS